MPVLQPDCERAVAWRADPAEDGDGLEMSGYAAVFGEPTLIEDYEGRYMESIAPGAFRKTLRERGDRVVLMLEHGRNPLLGTLPLGKIVELREDDHGLFVKARLHDNWLTQPVRDAIASGALKDMSFRFRPIQQRVDKSGDVPSVVRTEVSLIELGPVSVGAYSGTEVALRAWADAAPEEFRSTILASAHPKPGANVVVNVGETAHPIAQMREIVKQAAERLDGEWVQGQEAVDAVKQALESGRSIQYKVTPAGKGAVEVRASTDDGASDTMTDESTPSPAGSATGNDADGAADRAEPVHKATRCKRDRHRHVRMLTAMWSDDR